MMCGVKKNMAKKEVKQSNLDAGENQTFEHKESVKIPDGSHKGQIKSVTYEKRNEFEYIDVRVSVDGFPDITIKTGFPATISENSSLGKFLQSAGMAIKPGKVSSLSDIRDTLIDRSISYQTYTDDVYARIVNKTIKFV